MSCRGLDSRVLSLCYCRLERHILASGSADKSVLLWDLNTAKPTVSISEHKDRVQGVRFHPFEAPSLLSASADGTVRLWDVRDSKSSCRSWEIGTEIESVLWDHFSPFHFFAACEPGNVVAFDVRQASTPVFTVCAHEKSVTCKCQGHGPEPLLERTEIQCASGIHPRILTRSLPGSRQFD